MALKKYSLPTHFSKSSKIGFFASLVVSIISVFFLWFVKPSFNTSVLKPIGKLADKKNLVSRQHDGSLTFYSVDKNQTIYQDDQIFTADNSSATLILSRSQNSITLRPNTLVKIQESDHTDAVEIKSGELKFNLRPKQDLRISKENNSMTILNKTDKDSGASLNLESGNIALSKVVGELAIKEKDNINSQHNLKKDDKIILDEKNSVRKIFLTVISPQPYEKTKPDSPLILEWESNEKVNITISKNKDYSNPIFEEEFSKGKIKKIIPKALPDEGEYFLRFKCKGTDQEVTIPINSRPSFYVNLIAPLDNAKIQLSRKNNKVKLTWDHTSGHDYKLVYIVNNKTPNEILTDKNEYSIASLSGDSEISWYVIGRMENGQFPVASAPWKFSTSQNGENILTAPLPDKQLYYLEDKEIPFKWEASDDEEFVISFYKRNSGQEPLMTKNIRSNHFNYPMSDLGEMKMTLHSLSNPDFKNITFDFNVYQQVAVAQSTILNFYESSFLGKEIQLNYEISPKYVQTATLEVSKAINSDEIEESIPEISGKIAYKIKRLGTLCFSVNAPTSNPFVTKSKPQCTLVDDASQVELGPPENINLTRDIFAQLSSCILIAPKVSNAISYEFKVYSSKKPSDEIFSGKSATNKLIWFNDSIGLMDYRRANTANGSFYYNYRVINKYNRTSAFSPMAKITLPLSIISIVLILVAAISASLVAFQIVKKKMFKPREKNESYKQTGNLKK